MSRETAAAFLMRVRTDTGLQSELGRSPSPEAFVQKAESLGMSFSPEELRGVIAAERFYQKASDDPVLFKRVNTAAGEAEVVAIAHELGFECGGGDLAAVLRPHAMAGGSGGELSDEQLESVAGGGFGIKVTKVPAPPAPFVPIPYPSWG